jgi:tetraacyldisaccharide 4'-kinase
MILCIGQQMIPALADLNNIIQMDFEAHHDDIERFKEHDYIAFAGIGTPGKFFDTLSKYSIPVIDAIPFPDHHLYTDQDLQMLVERAKSQNARLMTTGKDAVKLAQYRDVIGQSLDVLSVSLKVEEQGWHQIDQMITDTLNHNFTGKPLRRDHKKR